ncbi:MAG: ABC-F family ATP-binding cassette domain-containing protein, partial [Eubacterium sp.]|nr:ABC-F family ATP-binding cassette domain-containing protein [Eubacterium sp.]
EDSSVGYLSQIYEDAFAPDETVARALESKGMDRRADVEEYLKGYCFSPEMADRRIGDLSGGERNLLQLALLGLTDNRILLLDEPDSHLDLPGQSALEKAIREYPGTLLMISHDFYTIANCMDYVLYVENRGIRRMSGRAFRKMFYKKYYSSKAVETEKQKRELEQGIQTALKNNDPGEARKLCSRLAELVDQ